MTVQELIRDCRLIDAHSHSDDYENRAAMIREVEQNRIFTLNSAVDPASMERAAELKRRCPWIQSAAGIHPWKAGEYDAQTVETLEESYRKALQISEIGLDRVWAPPGAGMERQKELLAAQLVLAVRHNKPVTLHTKGAEREVLDLLKTERPPSLLVHWFDGTDSQLREYLDLGAFFTISPAVFTDRAYLRLLRQIPRERLLPETDNPGSWPWLFDQPGRPLQIGDVIREWADLKGCEADEFIRQCKMNLKTFLLL